MGEVIIKPDGSLDLAALFNNEFKAEIDTSYESKYIRNLITTPKELRSIMEILADLSETHPKEYKILIEGLIEEKGIEWVQSLRYNWEFCARPKQKIPDGDWNTWCILAGRGFGKTRTGAETVRYMVETGQAKHIALIGPTASDVNSVMVGGESGLLNIYPEKERPEWNRSNRTVTWYNPDKSVKAVAQLFSADSPERLRGPQFDFGWCDEIAAWRYQYAWDMYSFALRLGDKPRTIVTTTPKPIPILVDILSLPNTWTTQGTTYENRSNLAKTFFTDVIKKYEGNTYLGRQELHAEIIDSVDDAMWRQEDIDNSRIDYNQHGKFVNSKGQEVALPDFLQVVIAIDPATTTRTTSAETAMCVAAFGSDGEFYILDMQSGQFEPDEWARKAVSLYNKFACDKMIAEVNNGGDLVETVIKTVDPYQKVYAVHASRGKAVRAEPVASVYRDGKVHHIGRFGKAENQMTTFNPQINPYGLKDLVDALVWAMTFLLEFSRGGLQNEPAVGAERQNLSKYQSYMKHFRY